MPGVVYIGLWACVIKKGFLAKPFFVL